MNSIGMPKFGEDLNNVTVPVGREAIFVCNVEGLATYKVKLFTLSIHTKIIQPPIKLYIIILYYLNISILCILRF